MISPQQPSHRFTSVNSTEDSEECKIQGFGNPRAWRTPRNNRKHDIRTWGNAVSHQNAMEAHVSVPKPRAATRGVVTPPLGTTAVMGSDRRSGWLSPRINSKNKYGYNFDEWALFRPTAMTRSPAVQGHTAREVRTYLGCLTVCDPAMGSCLGRGAAEESLEDV